MKLAYIPNLLCVVRMLLVAPMLWLLARHEYRWAVGLFMVAGATDALDGYLAKRFGWRSRLGSILDPIADKLLLSGVFLTLGFTGVVPWWLVALVVARDLLIIGGAAAYRLFIGPLAFGAQALSKVNTAAQLAFVLALVLQGAFALPPPAVTTLLGALVTATTILSGADYVWSWSRRAWRVKHGTAT